MSIPEDLEEESVPKSAIRRPSFIAEEEARKAHQNEKHLREKKIAGHDQREGGGNIAEGPSSLRMGEGVNLKSAGTHEGPIQEAQDWLVRTRKVRKTGKGQEHFCSGRKIRKNMRWGG